MTIFIIDHGLLPGYDPNDHDDHVHHSLNPGFNPGKDEVDQDNHDDHILL